MCFGKLFKKFKKSKDFKDIVFTLEATDIIVRSGEISSLVFPKNQHYFELKVKSLNCKDCEFKVYVDCKYDKKKKKLPVDTVLAEDYSSIISKSDDGYVLKAADVIELCKTCNWNIDDFADSDYRAFRVRTSDKKIDMYITFNSATMHENIKKQIKK